MRIRHIFGSAAIAALVVFAPAAAHAQSDYVSPPPVVDGEELERPPAGETGTPGRTPDVLGENLERPAVAPVSRGADRTPDVLGVTFDRADVGALAVTGGDVAALALLGAAAIAGGAVIVKRSRRTVIA